MNMYHDKAARQATGLNEIEELEKLMQEGSPEPTQSPEVKPEGSPEDKTEGIAGQELSAQAKQEPVQDLTYWKERALQSEQRYNVSKPKYDSNIFRLRTENANLEAEKVQLYKQLNELQQSLSKDASPVTDMLTSKQVVDVLGKETADTIRQNILDTNARVDAQEQRLRDKEIADQEERLNTSVDARYNQFINTLTELVPDQAVLNKDPKFLEFLQQPDANIGVIRFDLLREAEKAGHAARVASFFNEFKRLNKVGPADSINKRISPDSKSVSTTEINSTGGEISTKYIDKFFEDVRKGEYKGRYKEQMAIQASIDEAYIAGKIIQ